jgi:phosphatidylglycerol lysyltransferase
MRAALLTLPLHALIYAALLTALNYGVLTGYDLLAFRYAGARLARRRIVFASFISYAISNSVGLAMLSGTSVRFRFYTRWGVSAETLARVVFSYSVTFWLGLLGLGGLSLIATGLSPAAGAVLMTAVACYLGAALVWRRPIRVWRFTLPIPSPTIAAAQIVLSSVDWVLAALVLYVLLPPHSIGFLPFAACFLAAMITGLVSHVPGGLGVFDTTLVFLLSSRMPAAGLVPALLAYRTVYYLGPLALGVTLLAGFEAAIRRRSAGASSRIERALALITRSTLPAMVFAVGLVLLFSGATPPVSARMTWLSAHAPIAVIEAAHFLGSIAGVLLLLLSQGLARRLDAAWLATVGTLTLGIAASLLKGLDYEEALAIAFVLAALIYARPIFHRRAAFFSTRFSASWTGGVVAGIAASVFLGFVAFRHVPYTADLWWQFAFGSSASRFLRASVGTAIVLLAFVVARMARPAAHVISVPSEDDLKAADAIIRAQSRTLPHLAFLGDKGLLFNADRTGFVMYGVRGTTWVALGDPVGPIDVADDLIRDFLERCHDFNGTPAFYQVTPAYLPRYAEFGLTFVKLGEEAHVDLAAFALDGPTGAPHRQAIRRLAKDGATFAVLDPLHADIDIDALRRVSDDWLARHTGSEKGFSLGFFDADYLSRGPLAVITRDGEVEAFANLWIGADHREASIDLMRHTAAAPKVTMEALISHLLVWAKTQGFAQFVLGMAPLSGFDHSPAASRWTRMGSLLYRHGDRVYRFRGLRRFKDKFHPVWESRYLAYPGGLRLPRVLTDVSALIAGGYRQIFLR